MSAHAGALASALDERVALPARGRAEPPPAGGFPTEGVLLREVLPPHEDPLARARGAEPAKGAEPAAGAPKVVAPPGGREGLARSLAPRLAPWAVPLLILAAWQAVTGAGLVAPSALPSPLAVLRAGWGLALTGELFHHVAVSAARAGAGFALGGGLGLLLGLATGLSRRAALLADSTLQMLRTVPPLAIIPLVILWLGIGEAAKVFVVAFAVFFPVYLNAVHGVRSVDPQLVEMGRAYGMDRRELVARVLLPGALPSVLSGVRYALGLAWVLLIVAETIAASSGLGYLATNAREFLMVDVVVLTVLLYAALGKLTDLATRALERRLLAWNPAYAGGAP